jgi:hypothetical protein
MIHLPKLQALSEAKSAPSPDTPSVKKLSDEDINKILGKELGVKFKLSSWKYVEYVVRPKSVELKDQNFPYNVWREGDGHTDDNFSLGLIGMTKVQFVEWLQKVGAQKYSRKKGWTIR